MSLTPKTNAASKEFDPIATAVAVRLIAAERAQASLERVNKNRSPRASSPKDPKEPAVKRKQKKSSEKGKKKSVTHSPTAKDHNGRKDLAAEEISTQHFDNDSTNSLTCPSVTMEKSKGDDEVFVVNEVTQAIAILANDSDFNNFGTNTEMAEKALEARLAVEKLERELKEEEEKMEEEDKKSRTEEEERKEAKRKLRRKQEEEEEARKEEKKQKAALQTYLEECENAKEGLRIKRDALKARQEEIKRERERKEALTASPTATIADKTILESSASTFPIDKTVVEPDQGWQQSKSLSAKKREENPQGYRGKRGSGEGNSNQGRRRDREEREGSRGKEETSGIRQKM